MGAAGASRAESPDLLHEGGTADLETFRSATQFDVHSFQQALDAWLGLWHMQCTPPWLVGWYNDVREQTAGGQSRIEADDNAVAFAICSLPGYGEVIAEHYARSRPDSHFIDAATNEIMEILKNKLPPELDAMLVNTDSGPPYYHVQSVGHVSGYSQHLEAVDVDDDEWKEELGSDLQDTRDEKMWGTDTEMRRKIFGVNVHPVYGGWFSYRIVIVLRGVLNTSLAEGLVRPAELKFVEQEDAKRILHEYNLQHDLCRWRDLTEQHQPNHRYTPDEYLYITETKPAKRKRFLEMKVAHWTEVPKLRG
jgi:hypothetical protein